MSVELVCLSCGGDIAIAVHGLNVQIGECEVCHMLHTVRYNDKGEIMKVEQDVSSRDLSPERKELLEKLRELQTRHIDVKGQAKAAAKDYRDQLADIDKEIDDTLEALKEQA